MPLHDWSKLENWDGFHLMWIAELFRWIKPRLPVGYRAYIGTLPTMSVSLNGAKPDVAVRSWNTDEEPEATQTVGQDGEQPDGEVALISVSPDTAILIQHSGRVVAAIELVSPGNKDRASWKQVYQARYLSYLKTGCNLLLVDVHSRPRAFSFFKNIGAELDLPGGDPYPPAAVSYRIGEPTPDGGRFVAYWRRPCKIGEPLPTIPIALTVHDQVPIDLDCTYSQTARELYLE